MANQYSHATGVGPNTIYGVSNMKRITQFAAVLLLAGITSAYADVSGNVGWDSEYIFRGVPQADSSANGGVDWEDYGFNAGVWLADVDEGWHRGIAPT